MRSWSGSWHSIYNELVWWTEAAFAAIGGSTHLSRWPPPDYVRADSPEFLAHRRRTLARLATVNRALSRWDEVDAAELMPPDIRPRVRRPTLDRQSLKELQRVLVAAIAELEERRERETWERRN